MRTTSHESTSLDSPLAANGLRAPDTGKAPVAYRPNVTFDLVFPSPGISLGKYTNRAFSVKQTHTFSNIYRTGLSKVDLRLRQTMQPPGNAPPFPDNAKQLPDEESRYLVRPVERHVRIGPWPTDIHHGRARGPGQTRCGPRLRCSLHSTRHGPHGCHAHGPRHPLLYVHVDAGTNPTTHKSPTPLGGVAGGNSNKRHGRRHAPTRP